MSNVVLKVEQLYKKFGAKEVLKGLDLEVNQGDLIYIKGINGSGKSTLLKLICNILDPDSGHIHITPEVTIGALIENPAFLESRSLHYNLKFLADFNNRYDLNKITQLCEQFDLDIHDRRSISKYSVGMRQKAGIIQAFMEDQNLILLDEPTRGIDEQALATFSQLIKSSIQEGKTIIIAAHDKIDDLTFTHEYVLKDGKFQQVI